MAGQLVGEYPHNTKRNGCLNCGSPRRPGEYLYQFDQVVDEVKGLDGETYGYEVAVICEECAVEIGTLMGCLSPSQNKRLQGIIGDLTAQLRTAELKVEAVKKAAANA